MDNIDKYLDIAFSNPYSKTVLTLLLVLYGGLAAPKLPSNIVKIFDNNIARVMMLTLIVYLGQKDAKLAIMMSICFVVSMDTLSKYKMFENFSTYPNALENGLPYEGKKDGKCPSEMCGSN